MTTFTGNHKGPNISSAWIHQHHLMFGSLNKKSLSRTGSHLQSDFLPFPHHRNLDHLPNLQGLQNVGVVINILYRFPRDIDYDIAPPAPPPVWPAARGALAG